MEVPVIVVAAARGVCSQEVGLRLPHRPIRLRWARVGLEHRSILLVVVMVVIAYFHLTLLPAVAAVAEHLLMVDLEALVVVEEHLT